MIFYAVFHPSDKWWARRFSHVSLLTYQDGVWSHIDLGRLKFTFISTWREEAIEEILSIHLHYCTLVKVDPGTATHFFQPMTCVSFVKHALGSPSRALRPDPLFRDLCRQGEIVNDPDPAA